MMNFLASFSTVILLFQAVFFGSGLYGVILENEAKFCTCNHNSVKELHENKEDLIFKRKIGIKTGHFDHESSLKPTCHSAKTGEPHLCVCKKAKKKADFLQPFVSLNQIIEKKQRIIYPQIVTLTTFKLKHEKELIGFRFLHLKPPKT